LPRVKASEEFLDWVLGLLVTLSLMIDAVSIALLLAEDMLSLATCVIGAAFAFLGHVRLYQDSRLLEPFCRGSFKEEVGLTGGSEVLGLGPSCD